MFYLTGTSYGSRYGHDCSECKDTTIECTVSTKQCMYVVKSFIDLTPMPYNAATPSSALEVKWTSHIFSIKVKLTRRMADINSL